MRILRVTATPWTLIAALVLALGGCDRRGSQENGPFYFTDHVEEVEKEFDETQFVSFRKGGLLSGSFTLSDETRLSLAPPLPSRLTFVVSVPTKGLLQFGMGVLGLNKPPLPARVRFRIHIDAGRGQQTVFKGSVPRDQPNRWVDKEVDLSRWENSTVRLTFETTAPDPASQGVEASTLNAVVPLWGNPVLARSIGIPARPNVLLISIDCLRSDHVGAYGYPRDTTPRIDRLAADGVLFETALATAPETLPSHMSIFTGLYPAFHGASKWRRLSESTPVLSELLAQAGYEVNGVVTGAFLSQSFGFERGFRDYRFFDDPGAETTIDAALELLRRASGRSQFLWVHLFDPHWPYLPPKNLMERFGPRPADISGLLQNVSRQHEPPANDEAVSGAIDLYDAEIVHTDRELGRLLDELESTGLYDRSLIIVVGDHGEAFHEHGLWQHTLTLYDEMIRIPLIVKWPASSPKGITATPVSQVDLFSTVLETAGVRPPPNQGVSLLELFRPEGPSSEARHVISEAGWKTADQMFRKISIRAGDSKYIVTMKDEARHGWPPSKLHREELFDLERDPAEQNDLAQLSSANVGFFRQLLRAYLDEAGTRRDASRPGSEVVLDEQTRQRLRALGYLVDE